MAQLLVRNIENGVKARLQRRARRNGHSMEEEVRNILRAAVHKEESTPSGGLGTQIAALFPKSGPDFVIEELRGDDLEPPTFDE
jgi:antitoxin FitA